MESGPKTSAGPGCRPLARSEFGSWDDRLLQASVPPAFLDLLYSAYSLLPMPYGRFLRIKPER